MILVHTKEGQTDALIKGDLSEVMADLSMIITHNIEKISDHTKVPKKILLNALISGLTADL